MPQPRFALSQLELGVPPRWMEAQNGFEPLTAALQTAPFGAWVRRRRSEP